MLISKKYIPFLLATIVSINAMAQSNQVLLANEYFNEGEVEKAMTLYEDLADNYRNIPHIHNNYFSLLLGIRDFGKAEKYISKVLKRFPDNTNYVLDRGLIFHEKGDESGVKKYYEDYIKRISSDVYKTRVAANYFINKQLIDYAILAYQESRKTTGNNFDHALQLANLYRLVNDKILMAEEYLNFINTNPANLHYVKNSLQRYLSEPEDLENLERSLISKVQQEPDNEIYTELLIWTYLQQKNFYGAFIQARALDKRKQTEASNVMNIGRIALDNNDYKTAILIYEHVIDQFPRSFNSIVAKLNRIRARELQVKDSFPIQIADIRALINDYDQFVKQIGQNRAAQDALHNKALLHAFYLDEKDSAIRILNKIIEAPRSNPELIAQSKLDLGDIYILTGSPWESSLLYSQVEKAMKETNLGYDAKLRNARLSYFRGDFLLAQEHLDILKTATTREIANDAMGLSIFIKDNTAQDSTDVAMQEYSNVELLLFQNKPADAASKILAMLETFEGHSITDDLHLLMADLLKRRGDFAGAVEHLKIIVDEHYFDILGDDAYFELGNIYENQLADKENAMEVYRDFLVKYPGSIYSVEARKRFRSLRGDFDETEVEN